MQMFVDNIMQPLLMVYCTVVAYFNEKQTNCCYNKTNNKNLAIANRSRVTAHTIRARVLVRRLLQADNIMHLLNRERKLLPTPTFQPKVFRDSKLDCRINSNGSVVFIGGGHWGGDTTNTFVLNYRVCNRLYQIINT